MIFACEIGRPGKKLFTDTLATMLRRDDETSDPANRRAVWKIWVGRVRRKPSRRPRLPIVQGENSSCRCVANYAGDGARPPPSTDSRVRPIATRHASRQLPSHV